MLTHSDMGVFICEKIMPSGIYKHKVGYKIQDKYKGKNHYRWKGGISRTRKYQKQYLKERRHRLGISKRYNLELGISYTKEYKRLSRKQYKARVKGGGELLIKTIQLVYEDNIKRYGTLTCYLCEKPIELVKEHLEHKTPLSRGGTNEYNNLGIACQKCNCKKHTKTEEEFRKEKNL